MFPRAIIAGTLAFASAAHAQNTQITFEGSYDQGQTWHGGTIPYAPGNTLHIRARVSLINATTQSLLGMAGITFQPTLSNFVPSQGDVVLPFTRSDGMGVPDDPQSNTGRILPFASSGMGSAAVSGLLTHHLDPSNILRFAGSQCLTPTTNLAWGVSCGQVPLSIAGSNFRTGTDVVVFRYAVQLNSVGVNTDWTASVDVATVLQRRASWYSTQQGTNSLLAPVTQDTIIPLRIVIPAPATLALALVGCTLSHRRRSREASSSFSRL